MVSARARLVWAITFGEYFTAAVKSSSALWTAPLRRKSVPRLLKAPRYFGRSCSADCSRPSPGHRRPFVHRATPAKSDSRNCRGRHRARRQRPRSPCRGRASPKARCRGRIGHAARSLPASCPATIRLSQAASRAFGLGLPVAAGVHVVGQCRTADRQHGGQSKRARNILRNAPAYRQRSPKSPRRPLKASSPFRQITDQLFRPLTPCKTAFIHELVCVGGNKCRPARVSWGIGRGRQDCEPRLPP